MRRVLLVEDDPDLAHVLVLGLARRYMVEVAHDGAEALERLAHAVPDVLVTDLQMSGVDGAALVRACRRDPRTAGVPILLLSGSEQIPAVASELRVGAWLQKPVSLRMLLAHVERLVGSAGATAGGTERCGS